MAARGNSISKTFVWILLAMLIVGLAGFGATNLGGNLRSIGAVGDKSISVDLYARTLQEDMRALTAQAGQAVPFSTAQQFGVDQQALARVVTIRALDHETAQLGLSIGDEALQKQILSMTAFQGLDGTFDRGSYRFALENAGLSEAAFEESLREEAARTLVQGAILSGNTMPDSYANTLIAFINERRNATIAALTADDLETELAEPTQAEMQAYYDENIANYTLPETKKLTYVWLSPDMITDTVEIEEDLLRAAYDERSADFNRPERRLVERLVYGTQQEASDAKAQLEAGGTSFETLVQDRGLNLTDVDLGDVSLSDLGAAGDAVFAAETGTVVGPLDSDLGPALFRLNGILSAEEITFEEARAQLQDELAADRARRIVEAQISDIDDLLAAGATLEELAKETEMELATLDWSPDAEDGIAAYETFREAAAAVQNGDFPQVEQLEDGGIFALRLDLVLAPRPQPLDEVIDRVRTGVTTQKTRAALRTQAETLTPQLSAESDFAGLGLSAETLTELTRTDYASRLPTAAVETLFNAEPGSVFVADDGPAVLILRLDAVVAADLDSDDAKMLRTQLGNQAASAVSQDLFNAFSTDIQQRAGIQLDQNAINAVHASFQ